MLRPGGFMILLQDLKPELWVNENKLVSKGTQPAVEDYHKKLIRTIEREQNLVLLGGKANYLEGLVVRPFIDVLDRQDDENPEVNRRLMAHLDNIGTYVSVYRSGMPYEQGDLVNFSNGLKMQKRLDSVDLKPHQVIEWARLRYVVAQKKGY